MKATFLLLLFSFTSFVFKTNEVNQLKQEAKTKYAEKKYLDAAKVYARLESEFKIHEPQLLYNHANACYRSLQLKTAMKYYTIIADGKDSVLSSQALNQMGIIACRSNQLKEGRNFFKEALRKNAANTKAVLNLEWALALQDLPKNNSDANQQKEKSKQRKKKQNSSSNDHKTDPDGKEEESNALRSQTHQNKYMDLNKARLLLESMKNSEKQYLQQRPIHNATHSNEPAW